MTSPDAEQQQSEGISISNYLIERNTVQDQSPELLEIQTRFKRIYEKLPEVSNSILNSYQELLVRNNLNPGEVRLYMIGGRVKGKPLKTDSDIDLIFATENPSQSAEALQLDRFEDPIDAWGSKISLLEKIKQEVSQICKDADIPDEFHIINYGSTLPKDDIMITEDRILLASSKQL